MARVCVIAVFFHIVCVAVHATPVEDAFDAETQTAPRFTSIDSRAPTGVDCFAVFHLVHQAMRGAAADLQDIVTNAGSNHADAVHAFQIEFEAFRRAESVHTAMEEDGLLPLLAKRLGSKSFSSVYDKHVSLGNQLESMRSLLLPHRADVDISRVTDTLTAHVALLEEHMKLEDDVLPPLIESIGTSMSDRCSEVHESLQSVWDEREDLPFFVTWTVRKLAKHKELYVARMFVQALQYSSTVEQWSVFLPAVQAGLSWPAYEAMRREFHVQVAGKIPHEQSSYAKPDVPHHGDQHHTAIVEQIHIAFGSQPHSVRVVFTTFDAQAGPFFVDFEPISRDDDHTWTSVRAFPHAYRLSDGLEDGWSGRLFSALLYNLHPSHPYRYRIREGVGQASRSRGWIQFTSPPETGLSSSGVAGTLFIYGDTGLDGFKESVQVLQRHTSERHVHSIVHIGDFSYATFEGSWDFNDGTYRANKAASWDRFLDEIQPLASHVPYMTLPGNHETYRFDDRNFAPYEARFRMPGVDRGHPSWYSFQQAGFHIVMLSSDHPYKQGSPQYTWLEQDLASVNRTLTPWLITATHRPIYSSNKKYGIDEKLRSVLGPLLDKHQVDVHFAGHHHMYERSLPLRSSDGVLVSTDPRSFHKTGAGTVHILAGCGGMDLVANSKEQPNLRDAMKVSEEAPEWSAFRHISRGYASLEGVQAAADRIAVEIKFVSLIDGSVLDSFLLTKPRLDLPVTPRHEEL